MSTGSRARHITLLILIAGVCCTTPSSTQAQALKLESLQFPITSVVGPWVSYRVRTQARSIHHREYTQRVAIVSRELDEGQDGFWVELKTEGLSSGMRIERGFFIVVDPVRERRYLLDEVGMQPESLPPMMPSSVRMVRYQVLTSGGKLFEYPVEKAFEARTGGEVSTLELFEYDASIPPLVENLGPDTLRIGRRIVPTVVERTRRASSDSWATPNDSTTINRPVLIQTLWRNAAVPVTGFARSLFQVMTERIPVADRDSMPTPTLLATAVPESVSVKSPPDSLPPPPSAANSDPTPDAGTRASRRRILSTTELVLLDLGADAIPEVTQEPEPEPPADPEPSGTHR